ncbi:hypothetical protein NQ317_002541 [Molorchus minor]|uniref:Odorant receptor n=1 Tax=Molorchus minor TaxID=1323400 RepID=A0ABQ9JCZ7_9CUCU|nr:hypothetical protein NQ317_002541 [Molorchus minor]
MASPTLQVFCEDTVMDQAIQEAPMDSPAPPPPSETEIPVTAPKSPEFTTDAEWQEIDRLTALRSPDQRPSETTDRPSISPYISQIFVGTVAILGTPAIATSDPADYSAPAVAAVGYYPETVPVLGTHKIARNLELILYIVKKVYVSLNKATVEARAFEATLSSEEESEFFLPEAVPAVRALVTVRARTPLECHRPVPSPERNILLFDNIYIFLFLAFVFYSIQPLFANNMIKYYPSRNETVIIKPLPLSSWFPFDEQENYLVCYIWQIIDVFFGAAYFTFSDIFNLSIIIFALGQIRLLKYILNNFETYVTKIGNQLSCSQEEASFITLRQCILKHKEIIWYINEYNAAMRYVTFLEFLQSSVQLAATCLQLLMVSKNHLIGHMKYKFTLFKRFSRSQ